MQKSVKMDTAENADHLIRNRPYYTNAEKRKSQNNYSFLFPWGDDESVNGTVSRLSFSYLLEDITIIHRDFRQRSYFASVRDLHSCNSGSTRSVMALMVSDEWRVLNSRTKQRLISHVLVSKVYIPMIWSAMLSASIVSRLRTI